MGQEVCDSFSFVKLKKRLNQFKELKLTVISDSMVPLIPVGGEIVIKPICGELLPFEIVVFWDGTKLVSHYIWKKSIFGSSGKIIWLTRSLKNPEYNDLPVEEEHILGVVSNFRVTISQKITVYFKAWRAGRL